MVAISKVIVAKKQGNCIAPFYFLSMAISLMLIWAGFKDHVAENEDQTPSHNPRTNSAIVKIKCQKNNAIDPSITS